MSKGTVAVVGSGSAGLGAGFRLHQAGYRVRMFESNDYVGGRMRTLTRDGFVIDEGATWIAENYKAMLGVIDDAGLRDQLDIANASFAFPRDGKLHEMDGAHPLRTGVKFNLLGLRSKLKLVRLVVDCLRYRRLLSSGDLSVLADIDDESAADYTLRRLGRETLDYVINPSMGCMAGDTPERLSKVDLLYGFSTFLFGLKAYMFRGGMSAYAQELAKLFDVELNARVCDVKESDDEVAISWEDADGSTHLETFDGCVLAVPPHRVIGMHSELDPSRGRFLDDSTSIPCVVVSVAIRSVPEHTRAAYIAVPDVIEPGVMVIGLAHNLRPGLTPPGKGLAIIYGGPELSAELLTADDDECAERVLAAVDRVVPGLIDDIEFFQVRRWEPMLLTSRPGYYRNLAQFNDIGRRDDRRIQLAGDYYSVSSMNVACASGERAAKNLMAELGNAPPGRQHG